MFFFCELKLKKACSKKKNLKFEKETFQSFIEHFRIIDQHMFGPSCFDSSCFEASKVDNRFLEITNLENFYRVS